MIQIINVISITKNVKDWLSNSNQPKILHVFDEVCNLINEKKEILSIVNAEIGNGPFNVVIEEPVSFVKHLDIDSKISIEDKQLTIGDLTISFAYAQMWNPMARWDELRKNKQEIINRLQLLQIDIENEIIPQSLVSNLCSSIIEEDIPSIKYTTSKLAGLGNGLTPAGDDYLMGAIHATWILHSEKIAKQIADEIAHVAIPLTTSLSGAWIKSASEGQVGELWHDFFSALIDDENIYLPMSSILAVGETSGSDALMGFLNVIARSGSDEAISGHSHKIASSGRTPSSQ